MLRKILTLCVVSGTFNFLFAQTTPYTQANPDVSLKSDSTRSGPPGKDSTSKTVISGSVDVYYRYDFNNQVANNKTSFTNSNNSFELGAARLKIEHTVSKLDMVAELAFGKRAQEFSYNDVGTLSAIRQLYISYSPWQNIKFTAGEWATHFNNEIFEPDGNHNYSMSYMFTYGPFFHTGVKAEATYGKNGFMLGITNPNDYKSLTDAKKYLIAQYSYSANDNFKLFLNYFSGQRPTDSVKVSQLETILIQKFNEKFNMLFIGGIAFGKHQQFGKYGNSKNWSYSGLYFNYDATSMLGFTLRTEYFNDNNQQNLYAAFPVGGSVFETTLSTNFKVENLTIIPEFRFENASQKIYTKSNSGATNTDGSFLIAAVYNF